MHKILLLAVVFSVAPTSTAQTDEVRVKIVQSGRHSLHVLMVQKVEDGELPRVKVKTGMVLLVDGELKDRLRLERDDIRKLQELTNQEGQVFRLYRGPEETGIFKYHVMSKAERPASGIWLEALALDRDETFQEMTKGARDDTDLAALLSMPARDAKQAMERERKLDEIIQREIDLEWETLRSADTFFFPTWTND